MKFTSYWLDATPKGSAERSQQVRIAPVGRFIIATEPLDPSVCDDVLPTRRVAADSKNLLNYFGITPDNRLRFDGPAGSRCPPASNLKGRAAESSGTPECTPSPSWPTPESTGVQMATYMGRQMPEYMSGMPEANIWRDFGFRRIPGHFGPPWFLPMAGAYYKLKDRVN